MVETLHGPDLRLAAKMEAGYASDRWRMLRRKAMCSLANSGLHRKVQPASHHQKLKILLQHSGLSWVRLETLKMTVLVIETNATDTAR